MIVASVASLLSALAAIKIYSRGPWNLKETFAYKLSLNKFYVDEIYDRFILKPFRRLGLTLSQVVDESGINGALHALFGSYRVGGQLLSALHTGSVQTYALFMLFGFLLLWGFLSL